MTLDPKTNNRIADLLEALRSRDSVEAWVLFLDSYSSFLYQTARACTSSEDAAADCYLHICERLARNGFRKLLKFNPKGTASFATWLRVVARNLCFDWHRSRFGRLRTFKSLQHLSPLELEVYHCRFVHGTTQEETLHHLESRFPGLSLPTISNIEEKLQGSLSSRQQWILGNRKRSEFSSVGVADDDLTSDSFEIADARPNQEAQFAEEEKRRSLWRNIAKLSPQDRLIVQLRFEQELSLEEVSRLCGLQDAQSVHRRVAAILKKLRSEME